MTRRSLALVVTMMSSVVLASPGGTPAADAVWNEASREVFFAVLEGLYEDGVSSEAVELVLGAPALPEAKRFERSFVYACPLCHPAFEAFRLYGARPLLYGMKQPVDTLGAGLPPSTMERLGSSDERVRRDAVQELIAGWVERRLGRSSRSAADLADLARQMEKAKAQGERMLEASRSRGTTGWRSCAACDGGVEGARRAAGRQP